MDNLNLSTETRQHLKNALDALYTALLELDNATAWTEDYDVNEKIEGLYGDVLDMTTDIEETFGISTEDE